LNYLCGFVFLNFPFQETGFVYFFADPELSSSQLYLVFIVKSYIFYSNAVQRLSIYLVWKLKGCLYLRHWRHTKVHVY